ncbi:MAG: S-layer homology domain-containing protein [Oscillospiraceae bacterium]|nr:S-layer homology domain-containing protein [Oscillospiraceae bacterium]
MRLKNLLCVLLAIVILTGLGMPCVMAVPTDMKTSDEGVKFLERLQGFSAKEYSSSGKTYIGYGTECSSGNYPNGISEAEADKLLRAALPAYETKLNTFMGNKNVSLSQSQFDALMCFTWALGTQWMYSGCRIYDYMVNGLSKYSNQEIVNAIGTWCHRGSVAAAGLAERRITEARLFVYGDYKGDASPQYRYLILNANGGSLEHDIVFYEVNKPYGTLPNSEKSGYQFQGWISSDGSRITEDTIVDANRSVKASWGKGEVVYSDVLSSDWFYSYVSELSDQGVVKGYPDGSFKPANPVTCGEALKLIIIAAGYGEKAAVNGYWASGYLDFAVNMGFAEPGEITDLDAPMSRILIARVAAKALKLRPSGDGSPFADCGDGYLVAMNKKGILQGSYSGDTLLYKPDDNIKRSEISAVIWRICGTDINPNEGRPLITDGIYKGYLCEDVPKFSYDSSRFSLENGRMTYSSDSVKTMAGVDVSSWNTDINWNAVAADGISFAMIRLGYRGYSYGNISADKYFEANIKGAKEAGLKVGVYFYSQAINYDEAVEEAEYVLSRIKGYDIDMPVVFDWEKEGGSAARVYGLNKAIVSTCARAFCRTVEKAGYVPMVYFNKDLAYNYYDLNRIAEYDFWYADYHSVPSFYYDFAMLQYTSSGKVNGIDGNVDLDILLIK